MSPEPEGKRATSSVSEEIEDYLRALQQGLERINTTFDTDEASSENRIRDVSDEIFIEAIENQFSTWMSWFYNTIVYLLIINVIFFTSVFDLAFQTFAIALVILFPFYLWWAFLNSIPEIRVNDEVIFSRKDLTLRRQFLLGRTLSTYFTKEMVRNSPLGTAILGIALLLFSVIFLTSLL